MGGLIAFAYGNSDSYFVSTVASAVLSLIGALIMELFTGVLHFNDKFVWLILWIFLAATILLKRYKRSQNIVNLYQRDDGLDGDYNSDYSYNE